MTTIRFEPVAVRRRLVGKCPVCGKRSARSRKIEQTADAWEPDFTHADCEVTR